VIGGPAGPREPDRPDVSIVIATFNEEAHVEGCLRSIFEAEPFTDSFEVLVADGGSTDRTRERIAAFAMDHPEVRLLDNPGRYAPHGFNTGIRAARGDWIFILGAHSSYDRSYFRLCLETARRTGAENAGGRVEFRTRSDGLQARITRAVGTSPFGIASSPHRRQAPPEGPASTSSFGCFPRAVFERFGMYDERLVLNQDWELNQRIIAGGGTVWMNPAIRISYFGRDEIGRMLPHLWRTGRWNAYMWAIAPHSFTIRHAIPAAFAAALAVPGMGLLALASHQAAAVAAAAIEAARARDLRLLPLLPVVFLAVHASYGAGTIAGAWDVLRRRSPVQKPRRIEFLAPRTAAPVAEGRR